METRARLNGLNVDYHTGRLCVSLTLEGNAKALAEQLEEMSDRDLRIRLTQWRQKRSLDQNSYFWVLVGEMARELGSTPEEIHAEMIQRYPVMWVDEDGFPAVVTLSAKYSAEILGGYWKLTDKGNDKFKVWIKLKGTSDMDTKEMTWFLDRVIEEAKELGIETLTPDELERLRQAVNQCPFTECYTK